MFSESRDVSLLLKGIFCPEVYAGDEISILEEVAVPSSLEEERFKSAASSASTQPNICSLVSDAKKESFIITELFLAAAWNRSFVVLERRREVDSNSSSLLLSSSNKPDFLEDECSVLSHF